jgi:hypothetical protein
MSRPAVISGFTANWIVYAAELETERDRLREAIQNHKIKLNATAAIPTSIDRELWAALEAGDELN